MKQRIIVSLIIAFLTLPVLDILQDRVIVPETPLACFVMGITAGLVIILFTHPIRAKKKIVTPTSIVLPD